MKILNFGSINSDIVYQVPHIVKPGETISASEVSFFPGGKGANQSVALAKAGAKVFHGGKVGHDGKWLVNLLKDNNVNTDFIAHSEGLTGQAIIQLSQEGQNSIVLVGGGNQEITKEEINQTLLSFEEGDYLILQNEINLSPYLIEKAYEKKMVICLNPAPYSNSIKQWPLEKVDILIVNEIEGADLAGETGSFEEIIDILSQSYGSTQIILTAGDKGSYWAYQNKREYCPCVKTKVVDTTAAGDTFLGFFIAQRSMGKTIKEAMTLASKAASITVSQKGAMNSIPKFSDL